MPASGFTETAKGFKNCQDLLGQALDQARQVHVDFQGNMAVYLTQLDKLYDLFWRGPEHLEALNEELWQAIIKKYSIESTPYRVIGILYFKIHRIRLPQLIISEHRSLTKANLEEIVHTYSCMLTHIEWVLKVAPIFITWEKRFPLFQEQYQKASLIFKAVADLQHTCWQLYQRRIAVFQDLTIVTRKAKQNARYIQSIQVRESDQTAPYTSQREFNGIGKTL